MTTAIPSENILVAFNNPSALHIYRINKDFTPGEEVKQGVATPGSSPTRSRHPDNSQVILVGARQ